MEIAVVIECSSKTKLLSVLSSDTDPYSHSGKSCDSGLWKNLSTLKSFPSYKVYRATLIFVSLSLSQTSVYTARPRTQAWCIALCVSVLRCISRLSWYFFLFLT